MEVHHHPDLHHKPKKVKEYVLEFLMIFLAVTMGFLAESMREKLTDREKEEQAISSLVKCLASDTTQLNSMIKSNLLLVNHLDSLISLKDADLTKEENRGKFYEFGMVGFFEDWYFKTNDAAMQQLKSSGMLRLVRKQNIIDSIFGYELKNKVTVAQEADCYFFFKGALFDYKKVIDLTHIRDTSVLSYTISDHFVDFNYKKANQLRISSDKEQLQTVFNNAALMATAIEAYAQFMQEQKDYAIRLIALLNREYQIGKE